MTILRFSDRPQLPNADVCVVGSGPVGIALALACEVQGLSVLLLESGGEPSDAMSASLSGAIIKNAETHASMDIAVRRGLGGTSRWWGGRCVPFDDADFSPREWSEGKGWPLGHNEVRAWYDAAAEFLGCGPSVFRRPRSKELASYGIDDAQLERWTPEIDMRLRHGDALTRSSHICVVLGATVTNLNFVPRGSEIESIELADAAGTATLPVQRCVIACGGLETTRLLLVAQRRKPDAFGGWGGPLGRGYMGHLSGKLAHIVFNDPGRAADFDFKNDDGVYVRRRYTLTEPTLLRENLQNIAMWVDNPPFHDASHKNGLLSAVWLALSIPPLGRLIVPEGVRLAHVGSGRNNLSDHLKNLAGSPGKTLAGAWSILQDRFLQKPPKPGFLILNDGGRYALHFHAEQRAKPQSQVTLADACDAFGMPRLSIDFMFDLVDSESVVRAHEILDRGLRLSGEGRLECSVPKLDRVDFVLRNGADGMHHIGTTRMGASPRTSVVDANCQVHGVENLFVASSSVFPSSGQANPTFLAVALAIRLAAFLSGGNVESEPMGHLKCATFCRDTPTLG
jgi:hypothetical protein